jgi:drug/metabolite transporter (DMT)-like permease
MKNSGFIYAIIAATLFGASVPASKVLLGSVSPWLLAGLLYAGSGIGIFAITLLRSCLRITILMESPLKGRNWLWLAGATFFGGVLGPVLLLLGLSRLEASATSLLLNLESVFTILIAWFLFREHIGIRVTLGAMCIVLGGIALSWTGHLGFSAFLGPILVIAACISWAIDNNLTRKVAANDPLQIAMLKSLVAGGTNIMFAVSLGESLPALSTVVTSGVVGFFGYGVSLLCFIYALRSIGTARTGAVFAFAPFVGAVLSIFLLGDVISWRLLTEGFLMAFGVWFLITERHEHEHEHPESEHEHKHSHDEHHAHEHNNDISHGEPHNHWHRHVSLHHLHPHYPDAHHRHVHDK